jgi:hypothetical protein
MHPARLALAAEVAGVAGAFLAVEEEAGAFQELEAAAIMDRTYHPHKLQPFKRAGHKVEAVSSTASQARYMTLL